MGRELLGLEAGVRPTYLGNSSKDKKWPDWSH